MKEKMNKYPGSLHNHTDYSNFRLRDAITTVSTLIDRAIELEHEVIAITEHDTISSSLTAIKHYKKIKKDNPNFKVLLGNEIYLCRDGLTNETFRRGIDKYYHFILIAKDEIGHEQIREISTRAWGRAYMARGMMRVPTYYRDLYDIIGKNPGHVIASTACFRKGTQVLTKKGYKNIEDITDKDYIFNRNGEWEKVNFSTSRFFDGIGYEIETSGAENKITCTNNHKFLTITANKQKPFWTEAENLITKRGGTKHILLKPIIKPSYRGSLCFNREEWVGSYIPDSGQRRILLKNNIEVTSEIMRLFGLFLADGCISLKKEPRVSLTLNIKELPTYFPFIEKAGEQLGISWNYSEKPQKGRVDITSGSLDLVDLFYYIFGDVKAGTKKIPAILKDISFEMNCELVFGYLLGDGYFRTRENSGKVTGYETGEFVSASISHQLSLDFHNLLNTMGITNSISKSKARIDKNGVNHKDAWYVCGSNKFLGRLDKQKEYSHSEIVSIFNSAISYKEKDFITIDDIKYQKIRIKNKKEIYLKEKVYCLNVDSHSFLCENVIVHNCLGGALPTQLLLQKETRDLDLMENIEEWCHRLQNLFGEENFYLEMQPSKNKEQVYVNHQLVDLSGRLGIPTIITNDAHYLKKEDILIHKAFLNAQGGDRETELFYATTYLMSDEEVRSFMEIEERHINNAYNNIRKIASMCEDFELERKLKIPYLPFTKEEPSKELYNKYKEKISFLGEFYLSEDESERHLIREVLKKIDRDPQYQNEETYKEIGINLKTILDSGRAQGVSWSAYLLNVRDYINIAWNEGDTLVGASRGSGTGFLLLNILGITQINPLREKTQTFHWRFLNPERASVLDIDVDIEGSKRQKTTAALMNRYGADRVSKVLTLRKEKAKSAILTAARGLGIDIDIAQYLSSMIESPRGMLLSLNQTFYGDPANDIPPNKKFRQQMEEVYPELWEVAKNIENLICGVGSHAGGLIFVDEPFYKTTALMKTTSGDIVTQFDLHDAEDVGLIKVDLLSVEALDKLHICLDLLVEYGYIEAGATLRDTYEKTIGIYNLERDSREMWEMCWNHEVLSLFQLTAS